MARRDAGLDELVDREAAFLAELEDRQLLVGEVLRTSGDTEVGDGFQGGVQEKVKWGLFRTVKDYSIQNIVWSTNVEQDGHYYRHLAMIFPSRNQLASKQITRTGRAEAVAKEGLAATLLQHVSPIEWDNVILYGQYVLDRARVR